VIFKGNNTHISTSLILMEQWIGGKRKIEEEKNMDQNHSSCRASWSSIAIQFL
jgi:hypothetical protein